MNPEDEDVNDLLTSFEDDGLEHDTSVAPGGDAPEPKVLTPEEQLADYRRQLDAYKSLDPIKKALDEDPSRVWDIRDALSGKKKEPPQFAPAPPAPRQPQSIKEALSMLTQEQRMQIETNLASGGLEAQAELLDAVAKMQAQQLQAQNAPAFERSAKMYVSAYKRDKQSERFGKQIMPLFERMMAGTNYTQFNSMDDAAQEAYLDMRWNAAAGQYYQEQMNKPSTERARNMGSSTGANRATQQTQRKSAKFSPEQEDELMRLAQIAGIEPKRYKEIMASVGSGDN